MNEHNKSLELTGEKPLGSRRQANNGDTVDQIRACSSTLCYVRYATCRLGNE
jgi:hypothetical protein